MADKIVIFPVIFPAHHEKFSNSGVNLFLTFTPVDVSLICQINL